MLKIYGQWASRTYRVAWLCKESAIPYEHVEVTMMVANPTCKADWYLKLNPLGRMPTIDDDGFVMWESAAINLYLAEKYQSPLWPADMHGKGRMLQWAFFIANDVEIPMTFVFQHRFRFPPEKRIPKLADDAEPGLLEKLGVLEAALAQTPFLQGARWGMADFIAASVLYSLYYMKYEKLAQFPHLAAWLKASCERPAARAARSLRGDNG